MAAPTPLALPADYDPAMPLRLAAAKYRVSRGTLSKWRKAVGYHGKPGALEPWTDNEIQQLRANFNTLSYGQIGALIGRTASAVKSRAIEMGLRKASALFQRDHRARFEGQRVQGIADMAAQHLRRDAPVFRCDADGQANPKGKCWRFGNLTLTEDEMLAKAERKGWRADAWRELAA